MSIICVIVHVQVIHNLSMWTAVEKNLTYDQLSAAADNAKKDLHMVSCYWLNWLYIMLNIFLQHVCSSVISSPVIVNFIVIVLRCLLLCRFF